MLFINMLGNHFGVFYRFFGIFFALFIVYKHEARKMN